MRSDLSPCLIKEEVRIENVDLARLKNAGSN